MTTIKDLKKLIAEIPEEYDDWDFVIRTVFSSEEDYMGIDETPYGFYGEPSSQKICLLRFPLDEESATTLVEAFIEKNKIDSGSGELH